MEAILITEEYWRNSHLSLVRYSGRIELNGKTFVLVNKEGKDLFECTLEADKTGRKKAIEPGESADLVDNKYLSVYRKVGREKFIEMLKRNLTLKEMKEEIKTKAKGINL